MNPGAMRTVRSSFGPRPSDLNAPVLGGEVHFQSLGDGPGLRQRDGRISFGGKMGEHQPANAHALRDGLGLGRVEVPLPLPVALEGRLAQEQIGPTGQAVEIRPRAGICRVSESLAAVFYTYAHRFGRM